MYIGEKIKKHRSVKKITQEELAEKAGISKNALWNYENDKRSPSIDVIDNIADALDIPLSELLNIKFDKYYNFDSTIILGLTYDILEEIYNGSYVKDSVQLTAREFMNSDKYFIEELRDIFKDIVLIRIEKLKNRILNKDNTPLVRGGYTLGVSYEKDKSNKMLSFELGNKLNDKKYLKYMINKYQQYLENLEKGLDNHNLPEKDQ